MKAYRSFLFCASCLGSASCSSNVLKAPGNGSSDANFGVVDSIQIMPYKGVCQGEATTLCYIQSEAGQQTAIYGALEGFGFEWGFHYNLEIKRIPIENPPADSGSFSYQVVKTNHKVQIDQPVTFELNFRGNQKESIAPILHDSRGNMSLDGHFLECDQTSCDELEAYLASGDDCDVSIELTMDLSTDKRFKMSQFSKSDCRTN